LSRHVATWRCAIAAMRVAGCAAGAEQRSTSDGARHELAQPEDDGDREAHERQVRERSACVLRSDLHEPDHGHEHDERQVPPTSSAVRGAAAAALQC
jgi:hypothetical protein